MGIEIQENGSWETKAGTAYFCVAIMGDASAPQASLYEFETAVFQNRGRLGGIISMEEGMTEVDKQRMQEAFKQKHAGAAKSGQKIGRAHV